MVRSETKVKMRPIIIKKVVLPALVVNGLHYMLGFEERADHCK
jgi:hypothetical protein